MADSGRAETVRRLTGGALLALCVGLAIARAGAQQQAPTPNPNVNVISGTGADGDWTLQRQNEPTMACSSRNPQNCLAGANDYRTVDIPFPTIGEKITGDAWLGWYTTKDGGLSWRTRLLPGYPQDTSATGLASPLKGYSAGADPIIRPGTNGLFYYGGLVFDREDGGGSAIFVARFIDNNNQEGTAGESIAYLGASIVQRIGAAPVVVARGRGARPAPRVARGPARPDRTGAPRPTGLRAGVEQAGTNQMVDKPWIAVDIPRAGAQVCAIGGPGTDAPLQTFPGGRVYMAYALFDGPGEERGRIMFSASGDCAKTWSPPRILSRVQSGDVNDDGVTNAADVARVQASYTRSCGQAGFNPNADTNNDCKVDLLDLAYVGKMVGQPVPTQPRLSQGAALAIDPVSGALQIAWRRFNDGVLPDAIVTVRSTNGGTSFSSPTVVATLGPFEQRTTTTTFRTNALPTLAIDGTGRAYLAWSARGYAPQNPDPASGDGRVVIATSTNGITWSAPTPVDNQGNPGHQIMPALAFAQGKLQLVYYDLREDQSQLFGQFVDELPILDGTHALRIRHTVDVWAAQADPGASPAFTPFRLSQYRSGGVPGAQTIQQLEFNPPNLPIFRSGSSPFMGDYLDVAPEIPFVRNGSTWSFNTAPTASPVFHGIWTDNRDIRPPVNGLWTDYTPPNPPFARPAMSAFDPSQTIPACVPGQAGMRNQNVYTARITRGLVVGALGNSRRLGAMQRSFPVFAQNNSTTIRTFRLTITNQPVGGQASFKQFAPLTTLDVRVPRKSTVARTVFARSSDPHAQINVSVVEIAAPGGAPVPNGQQGTIVLNPDPTTPDLENPDLENPDLENPDLENAEVHNPDLENATVRNPDLENPDLENPDLENPDLENTTVVNTSILNPDLENPDLENPDLENPDLENPDLENVDLTNGALSDTTWTVTNKGNTAGSYTVRLALNRLIPAGFKSQLLAHKIYQTPATLGCALLKQSQTVLLANIPNPRFVATGELANPDLENPDLENLTIAIAPGETARITLRVFDPIKTDAITFRAAESVTPVAVAQAVNTPEADLGITQPAAAGVLTSSAPVPGGTSGGGYATTLTSSLPGTWTVAGGTVPPGLTVDPTTGAVTGTPTTPGSYTFTARFQSTIGIIDYQTVTITVGAVGAAADVAVSAVAPTAPVSIGTPFPYTLTISNAGPAAATTVRLTDTLPEGTAFVSATTTIGSCQHVNGTLVCTLGTLASGGSATIVLTVRPTVGGTHTTQAAVTADQADPVATNNTALATASTAPSEVAACTTVCFSGPTSYIASQHDLQFGAVKGDFNEDGHIDLAYGPAGVNTVGILLGNGTGGFGAPTTFTIPGSPDAADVADFNKDGHLDVAIVSQDISEVWVLLGNGLGGFAAPATIALPHNPASVATADFNRDGNPDLAFGGSTAGALVTILLGNGNGSFQPPTTIGTLTGDSNAVVEDFNNDGNPDLAVGPDGAVMIILGNGASGFQTPVAIPVPNSQGILKVGDLTGDGFADLIVFTESASVNRLMLLAGNGAGGFGAPVDVGAATNVDLPATADLDSDGDLDLVWSRLSGGGVGIQLNNGSGTFAAPFYLSTPTVSQPIVADLNGDGRPDLALAVGGTHQSQVLVFLNTCDKPPADLAVALQGPTDPVLEGDGFAYNIAVTNNGPNPATGVQFDFTFSSSAEFVSIGGSPGNCSAVRNRLTCQLGTLASGAVSAFTVVVRPHAGGTLQSTAGVTATTSDPNPGNNAAFLETTVTSGASTFVVTNTNESGPGSLFQAIFEANDPGPRDTITFNIPGGGVHTITPTTRNLPNINQSVVIDATTQPGYAGTPLIEISGSGGTDVAGLFVGGANSIIRGLAINRFSQAGIALGGAGGHTVEASFIGTNPGGTASLGNQTGIFVNSPNNVIGGTTAAARNLISGNTFQGVLILSGAGTGNVVAGNFIGTNVGGTVGLPNGSGGVVIQSTGNIVGGTTTGSRNLISGNNNGGINISGATAAGNQVLGNFIGTNVSGSAALANGNNGVNISNGAVNNTVGGSSAAARNIISGNLGSGVRIQNVGTTGNTVRGNYVGTNAAGTAAIPNGFNGVEFGFAASGNTIGGLQPADGNLISGNTGVGVGFFTVGPGGNQALSNLIGTDVTGTLPVGNGTQGVIILSDNNRVGSLTSTVGNVIAFNGSVGVRVDSGTGNAILNNSIHSNGSLGIDLAPLGVTPNDPGDTDTGPNNLLNRPVLSSARTEGTNVLVQVALSPTPSGPGQIQFFANTVCDASGSGEGQTFLGVSSFGVNPGGDTNFEASFSAATVPAGSFLTATATDSGNNTSEFSACAQVAAGAGTANLSISKQDSPDPVTVGSQLTYLIGVTNLGPDASSNATVTDALPAGVTLVSATASAGACSGTTTISCALGSIANGSLVTVSIVVVPTAAGPLTNTATVSASGTDSDTSNNSATATTTVVAAGPQTFVVTNTLSSGAGSLRQAILDANAHVGPDTITFAIPGTGVRSISDFALIINGPVIVDATTQSGFAGTPIVELNGSAGINSPGLVVNTSDTVIRGFIVNRASGPGIVVQGGTNNRVEGNWIGINSAGTAAAPNGVGIQVLSSGNTIGGTTAATRNVVSGNLGSGITIQNATSSGNVVQGNFIGTNVTGTAAVPNQGIQSGVFVLNAPNNIIGGTASGAGNVISGNAQHALTLVGATATGNVIQGNLIGTAANGTTPLGNGGIGIDIVSAPGNTIGGAANGRNVVANNGTGMQIRTGADNNVVRNNLIASNGGPGIRIDDTSGNTIGGTGTGDGNIIQNNNAAGIVLLTATSARNAILGNSISGHTFLGIDIDQDGVTANDSNDLDNGPNGRQNFPVLTAAAGGVQGTLNSTPNGTLRIEFFGNTACDASGNGEGATFLGSASVTTDTIGNAIIPLFTAAAGQFVTATATDPANNTSEFSACVLTGAQPSLTGVSPTSAQQGTTLTVALTGQNTNFVQGTTAAGFGAGITVNSVTVSGPTSATANITISATAFTGGRTITVTTGTEIVTNAFAVTAGPAFLTALAPNSAQQGQSNLNITVTGQDTHFAQNLTTASFGGDITINTVTVTSATSATVNVTLQDFATAGLRTVTMTTDGENASLVSGFNVIAGTPRLTSVTPASGQQGQTLNVTATGQFTNFVNGTTTASFGPGVTVNAVSVTSATTATVNVTIGVLADVGGRTATLTTGAQNASSLDAGSFFSVTRGPAAIAGVNPSSGRQAESLTVTVTGTNTHFASGSTTFSFGGNIAVTSQLITSPTNATLDINISESATLGARSVTATTLGEVATLDAAFTVTAGFPAITTVSPSTGRQAETLNLSIVGRFTHFVNGTTTASLGADITVHSVTVTDTTHATLNVTTSPGAALGSRTAILTTGAEIAQLVGGFTVTPGQPTLFSINPVSAVQGTNATVILNGAFTNFTAQLTTAFFGAGITAGTVTVNGPTLASVPITISPSATSGSRSVTVTTGSEVVTLLNGFSVLQGVSTVTSIDPNAGQRGLTRNVSITGVFTNWQSTVTSVSYGAGVTVNSNVVNSPTSLTTNITIDDEAVLGPRDVVITTGTDVLTVPGGFVVNDVDVTAPAMLTLSPPYGSTGVPLNTAVTAEFNEPLNRSTVNASTFLLYDTFAGQYIGGSVNVDATGRVATFVPGQLLSVSRSYYVYLNSPITDVAGNHHSGQFAFFTTGFGTDTTGPTLRLTNPQNADAAIGRNVRVVLQFDRSINAATVGIGLRIHTGGVNVPGAYVLEDGQKRIRFTPASQLAANTDYTVTLTSQLRDLAGNTLTNPGTFVFTTGTANDTTTPTVLSYAPVYNDTDVGRSPVIRVIFSEMINPITLNPTTVYLYNYSTGGLVRTTIAIAPDRLSLTLRPDAPLEPFSNYYYVVSPFADLAGNTASLGAIFFRTGTVEDSTPPTVVSIDPTNGATNVPVNTRVQVVLSESIDTTVVPTSSVQLTPSAAGTVVVSTDRRILLFTPTANLAVSTSYTVEISGLRDSSGNTMSPVSSAFTTRASSTPDTTAPAVVSFSPVTGATNVAVSSPIVMTVSEAIRTSGLAGSMRVFANVPGYGMVQLAGTYSVNAAATIVTFTPLVPYPGGVQVTAYSNYDSTSTDLAGNQLQHLTATFTTAPDADTTAPTVVMVTPSDGATGIGPQAVVTLTFSEPLLPSTVNNDRFTLFAGSAELIPGITRSADNTTVFLTATLPFNTTITVVATGDVTDPSGNALEDFSSTFTTGGTIETGRPQILTQRPTGPGIPAGTDITLFPSKPLNESTVADALYVSQNGVLVEGAVSVSGGGTAIHFNPAANFTPGATVQVFMTGTAEDTFGNSLFDYSGSFTVAPDTTTQAPTVVRSSPVFYSSGNPTNSVIDIEFSEPLTQTTVTSANFFVVSAAGQPVAGTLSRRYGDRVVRFTPSAPFAANNYNYVYLTSGLRDLQNTPFVATNFYFYTGGISDATPPALTGIAPPDGATGVGINATVRLHFSEAVSPMTTAAGTLSLSTALGPIPASVTFNTGNTMVTLVPQVPLPASTTFTVTIDGAQDSAGNAVPLQTAQFTTGASADTVRPTVIASNVTAYGVNNVPTNTVFQITFDEPMDATTVLSQTATFLYDYGGGSYRAGTGSMSSDGLTFTFVPGGTLAVNHQHSLNMHTGFDLAGNQQNGFSLFFTTTFAGDTTPPVVSGVNPVSGSTGMPRNTRVEIRFSEPVSALSLGNVGLLTNGSTSVPVTKTLSDSNQLLTLRPNGLLVANRSYTVSVSGVRDTGNNVMAAPFTSTFTTGSSTDVVVPTVTATSPVSEDRGVGLNMVARLVFSEPINPLSVSGENFRLGHATGGIYLNATIAIAADRRSVTLTPDAPLLPYTRYYVQLLSFADVAGNTGGGTTIYFYTAGGLDNTAPTVLAVAPPNGSSGLPVNVRVTARMSEAIDLTSLSNGSIQLTPAAGGTVTLAADRVTLTFVPSANLAPSTAYSIRVSGLRDASANTMAPAMFVFTTGASATPDTTAPTIVSRSPANGAAGIGVTSSVTFTTSERITAAAVGPASVPVFAVVSGVGTIQLAGDYTVDATGTVITFTVTGAFPANATIQWFTNHNSSIRDMAGLLLPSQLAQFTTANTPDVTGPTVQTVTPTNGATDVGQYAVVTLTFSESIRPSTVTANTVALFAGPNRLSASLTHSLDNRMVFLATTLPVDSTITVIATSGITDLSGNAFGAFSSTFTTSPEYDITRPSVITQRPTGSGVSRNTPITLFLNKPVNPATVSSALLVAQNGVLVTGSLVVDGSNQAITFTPTAPFAALASVEVVLSAEARDFTGNTVNPHYGTFTIENDSAATAPALTRTYPVQYSSGNLTNTVVDLEFSEPLNPATVTPENVFVRNAAGILVPGTLSLRAGNRVVRFAPDTSFAPSNYNYVYYTSGLLDLQGSAVSGSNFYFYTGPTGDAVNPSISFIAPAAGTIGVGNNGSIRIKFSEAINPLTISADTVIVSAGSALGTTFALGSANSLLTVSPQRPLPLATLITVTVNGVEDGSGNPVPLSITSFTTGNAPDVTAPTTIATSILYGDASVPVNSVFEWTYSEPIDAGTIVGQQNILYDYTAGAYVQGGTLSVSPDSRTVTFDLPANLAPSRQHSLAVGSVADLAGNLGGGLSLFFTTSTASDETAPQVLEVTPASGMAGVPMNARVRIAFDEAVSRTSLGNVNVLVSGTPLVVTSRTLSGGDRVVTLALTGLLAPNTAHTISIDGVRDRAGNALPAPVTSTFTTGPAVDLISPANTVTTSPSGGASGVAVGTAPAVTFSEAVDPTSVLYAGTSGVVLQVAATSQIVPVVYSFSADRRTVTLTPVSQLSAGTQYRISVSSGVADMAGNTFPTFLQFVFTTQP